MADIDNDGIADGEVFDSDEMGYKEFKIKIFEIDYKNFHELNN